MPIAAILDRRRAARDNYPAGRMRPLAEQTILVTGATDGLGRALATDLAAGGAEVLVHGRDDGRGRDTLDEIRARTPAARVRFLRADLASLADVRDLAAHVERETERLDALVNNAGIGATTRGDEIREESRDGHELRFAVNYLSGYLLTRLLLGLLERSAPARIVNVSSAGQAPIDFDDVMLLHGYSGGRAYCQRKLAQVLFTFDLAGELAGRGVTATCLHPATYMPTKMVIEAGTIPANPLERGLEATRRLVADPGLDGVTGVYFNGLRQAEPDPQAHDPDARRRLRALSDELCGLS
jgi:NAD(P)-dependent dehydrogenase (short-subunit alcohol dehydrogenase family)